jgi:hypothetical protein
MLHGDDESYENLRKEIEHRQFVDKLFANIDVPNGPEIIEDYDCLRMMVGSVEDACGNWSAYSLKYVRKLADACHSKSADERADLIAKIGAFCQAY